MTVANTSYVASIVLVIVMMTSSSTSTLTYNAACNGSESDANGSVAVVEHAHMERLARRFDVQECSPAMYLTEAAANACAEAWNKTPNTAHAMGDMWMPGLAADMADGGSGSGSSGCYETETDMHDFRLARFDLLCICSVVVCWVTCFNPLCRVIVCTDFSRGQQHCFVL
jgi:hypothetical protein